MKQVTSLRYQTEFSDRIKVSVCCVTFNHAYFIRDTLEGFLRQETDFCVEILIHDDASTDGTSDIVADYANRYPGLIKAIIQTENQYSKGVNVLARLRESAQGEYLAYCEGDDYWQDTTKLLVQSRYLDAHPETVMVGQSTQRIGADGAIIPEQPRRWYRSAFNLNGDMSSYQLKTLKSMVPTCCKMFRNIKLSLPEKSDQTIYSDALKQSILGQYGNYHFIDGLKPAMYRVHSSGIWSKDNEKTQFKKQLNLYFILLQHYMCQKDIYVVLGFLKLIIFRTMKFIMKSIMKSINSQT